MKKILTLTEACLMDASGELGGKAKAKLAEHVAQFPKALLEYEIARGNMALLKSLPKVEMTDAEKKKMANAIKAGVQKKLLEQKREEQAKKRWKLIHKAVAGVSSVAAGLVIAMSINYLINEDHRQRMAVASTEQVLYTYYNDVAEAPAPAETAGETVVAVNNDPYEGLIDEITPEDRADFGPG